MDYYLKGPQGITYRQNMPTTMNKITRKRPKKNKADQMFLQIYKSTITGT